MLRLQDVQAFYGKSHVLHGVSLEVDGGQVVGLLGRNGVGKSTTLKAIMGLVAVQSGSITFGGHDLHRQKPYRIPPPRYWLRARGPAHLSPADRAGQPADRV